MEIIATNDMKLANVPLAQIQRLTGFDRHDSPAATMSSFRTADDDSRR